MEPYSSYLDKAMMALRYGFCLPRFFLKPLSLQECYALVRRRVEEREDNFLEQVRRGVYSNPRSPYYKLLRHADCAYGDLEGIVRQKGLEKTLRKLSDAGVYVTIEEYKGRKPVERGGLSFKVQPEDFDNPCVVPSFESRSSGTRGPSTRGKLDFDFLTHRAADYAVQFDALGLYGVPYAVWNAHLRHLLCAAKTGMPLVKWFLPLHSSKNKFASSYTIVVGRILGHPLPWPESAGTHEAQKVAKWLVKMKQTERRIVVWTPPTPAVRVCSAAREHGMDISGAHFISNGEPLTLAREQAIEAAGCRVVAMYSSSETGCVGSGCVNSSGDDVHVLKGNVAVIQQPRPVGSTGITVNALRVTALLPSAPKVLINFEMGDYGLLQGRACGCKFDGLGLTDHLSHIRSFEKLTSESMTFFAGDLANIIEELPLKFGGGPLDYQAIEEQGENGLSHLAILVSPKLGRIDEAVLIKTILGELERMRGDSGRMMARVWKEAGTVRVRREEPHPTKGGKVFSFQVDSTVSKAG